jgi:hypothetical protein
MQKQKMSDTTEENTTPPYYDILGIEPKDDVGDAFRRLEVYYDKNDDLESAEFEDITNAYEKLKDGPIICGPIDRAVWQWETLKDKSGSWNTLVRKAHKQARKQERGKTWDSEKGQKDKKNVMRGRDKERGRRGGGGGHDNED